MKVALKEIKDKMNIRYLFAKYAIAKQSDKSVVVTMEGEDIAICGEVVKFPDPVLLIQNDKFAQWDVNYTFRNGEAVSVMVYYYKRTGVGLRRISMIGTDLEEAVYKTVIALNRARHLQNVVDIPSKLLKREKSNALSSLADLKD